MNISGSWDPSETSFAVLNKETAPDVSSVYLTVAADLIMSQVAEPVRFVIETKYSVTLFTRGNYLFLTILQLSKSQKCLTHSGLPQAPFSF